MMTLPGWVKVYAIAPTPKPRQTVGDKWLKRAPVLRYRAFADEVRLRHLELPEPYYHVVFVLPMPQTWTENRKQLMEGCPHRQGPDKDNLEKALLDAVYGNDAHVWDGRASKLWGREAGFIVVAAHNLTLDPPINLDPLYHAASSSRRSFRAVEVPWPSPRLSPPVLVPCPSSP